jgi:hypothetical protein
MIEKAVVTSKGLLVVGKFKKSNCQQALAPKW